MGRSGVASGGRGGMRLSVPLGVQAGARGSPDCDLGLGRKNRFCCKADQSGDRKQGSDSGFRVRGEF